MTVRVLAIADEIAEALWGQALDDLHADVIVSCGDLPFEYLENIAGRSEAPVLYVPGNHDPDVRAPDSLSPMAALPGPAGCINIDGRIEEAAGLRIAGLGGSVRYRPGPNQYTQGQMSRRVLLLELKVRLSQRPIDVLVTHSPPAGYGDSTDPPHKGFTALEGLVRRLSPRYLIHGHVNLYGPKRKVPQIGRTMIINAIPTRVVDVET